MLYKVHLLATCKQTGKGHLTARGSAVQPGDAHCNSAEEHIQRQTHSSHRNGVISDQHPSLRKVISNIY